MWSECGATVLSNICLGILVVVFFLVRLCIVDTGIAHVRDMMELNVPPGLKVIALCVVVMSVDTLFFQAATNSRMNISVALGFFVLFLSFFGTVVALLAFAVPLKQVIAKHHLSAGGGAAGRRTVVTVAPQQPQQQIAGDEFSRGDYGYSRDDYGSQVL